MKKKHLIVSIFCLQWSFIYAQQDSLQVYQDETIMDELVITGQFEPQSIKKSVHNVRVISKEDIQNLAANNLTDVLNQYLNISTNANEQSGKSSASLFGLDSQYFKVLIDNIPVVSDTGLGTNIDLTQINLDNVERIEIIEGSMGVTHGANAVSGILNIITKKSSKYDWELSASAQEETLGNEFSFFEKGRHIQSLKASHNLSENWYASVGINRKDKRGFFDDRKGINYSINDGSRGFRQLPKEQLTTNTTIGYKKKETRIFYKFDYLNEKVAFYNPIVVPIANYPFPDTYFSHDKRFLTNRYFHHLNYYGKFFNDLIFNVSVSHQKQQRDEELFDYHFIDKKERENNRTIYHSKEVLYSTGTVTNITKSKKVDLQLGYEFVNENSFANASTGVFLDQTNQAKGIRKRIENYDVYAIAELNFTDRFSLRPGFRYSFQSRFNDQHSYSLGSRYLFDKGIEARFSAGYSYRTPNFDELYTYMVDSNHNIQGNQELVPEQSNYFEANIKKNTFFTSGLTMYNTLSSALMFVDDKISMVLISQSPTLSYKYINVNSYKMWNIAAENRLGYKNWNFAAGFSLIGTSQQLSAGVSGSNSEDQFLYTFNINTALSYQLPKYQAQFTVYFKHNGKTQQFVQTSTSPNETSFMLSELESYNWLDASIRKTFFNGKFETMIGARNILNVVNLQQSSTSAIGGGAHATSNNIMLGVGRSYFVKLTYNLNF